MPKKCSMVLKVNGLSILHWESVKGISNWLIENLFIFLSTVKITNVNIFSSKFDY